MEKMNKYETKITQGKSDEITSGFELQQDWDIWACTVMQQWEFLKSMHNQGFSRLSEFMKTWNSFSVHWVGKCTIQSMDGINTKIITVHLTEDRKWSSKEISHTH